jgi:hypothetical protein
VSQIFKLAGVNLFTVMLCIGVANAETISGKILLDWCQSYPSRADVYISAFNDTAEVARMKADESAKRTPRNATMYDDFYHRFIGHFCIPRQSFLATTGIVCTWLSVHNDALGLPAPTVIARSYQNTYPCFDE